MYRDVHKQRPQYQGLWVVSPEGKVLGAYENYKDPNNAANEVRFMLEGALRAYGPVTERKPARIDNHPNRGKGVRPDGAVTLAVSVRAIVNDRPTGSGAYDSITLSKKEWAAFSPPELKAGTRWTLPAEVTRRFNRCLSPISDLNSFPTPQELTAAEIRAAVVSVDSDVAKVAFRGHLVGSHKFLGMADKISHAEVELRGAATIDVKTGQLLALAIVFDGTYRRHPPDDKETIATAAGAEWKK